MNHSVIVNYLFPHSKAKFAFRLSCLHKREDKKIKTIQDSRHIFPRVGKHLLIELF